MRSTGSTIGHTVPEYWTLLSDDDKKHYRQLRKLIDPLSLRTARDQLSTKFQVILNQIQHYSIRTNSDDWKRCVVCGIVWLDGALAISTRQLRKLIGKCKSSINAGLQSLGYSPAPMSSYHASQLLALLPFLHQNSSDFRQWTIRTLSKSPLASPMGENAQCEPAASVTSSTFMDGIDSFDLTCQMLNEQEALSMEMDHHFLLQTEPDGLTFCSST
jgi:hypothetical protein